MMQSAALLHRGQMVAMLYTVLRHPTFKNVFAMYKSNESQAYNDDYYHNIVMMTTLMIMITIVTIVCNVQNLLSYICYKGYTAFTHIIIE